MPHCVRDRDSLSSSPNIMVWGGFTPGTKQVSASAFDMPDDVLIVAAASAAAVSAAAAAAAAAAASFAPSAGGLATSGTVTGIRPSPSGGKVECESCQGPALVSGMVVEDDPRLSEQK